MTRPLAILAASALFALPSAALAQPQVLVTVTGSVEFEQVTAPPLGAVQVGNAVTMTFEIDPSDFVDDPTLPTRGYPIDPATFTLTMGSVTVGLQNPSPLTPYFVLRNNDPAVDGFLLSTSLSSPNGAPLAVNGAFGPFVDNFYVTYGGSTLSSLEILDAAGTYDFAGLTVFNWTIDDGPFSPIGLLFSEMTIEVLAADPLLRRGDCNADSADNIADAIFLLSVLFPPGGGAPAVACEDSCDANDDGVLNIADAISVLGALFGTPPLPLPPPTGACGTDPTPDAIPCVALPPC